MLRKSTGTKSTRRPKAKSLSNIRETLMRLTLPLCKNIALTRLVSVVLRCSTKRMLRAMSISQAFKLHPLRSYKVVTNSVTLLCFNAAHPNNCASCGRFRQLRCLSITSGDLVLVGFFGDWFIRCPKAPLEVFWYGSACLSVWLYQTRYTHVVQFKHSKSRLLILTRFCQRCSIWRQSRCLQIGVQFKRNCMSISGIPFPPTGKIKTAISASSNRDYQGQWIANWLSSFWLRRHILRQDCR